MKPIAEFSERFSQLIEGMSYTKVGADIGVSKQTISAYVNGVRNPKKPTIQAIAAKYNVNPAWLIGYDVPKYIEKPIPNIEEGLLKDLEKDPTRLALVKWLCKLTPDQLQRTVDLLQAALLLPKE